MPQITQLTLSAHDGTEMVLIQGTFDADTAKIRVTTSYGYSLVTTPDRLWVCSQSHVLREQEHITVVTYDKAGNASAPYEVDVTVKGGTKRYRCGLGFFVPVFGSAFVALFVLIMLGVISSVRKRAPRCVEGEFVSPILAESVARTVAHGYATKLAVALMTTTGLWTFDHPFIAIMVAPFALVWLSELCTTRRVVRQFNGRFYRLEKRDNWIYINNAKLYAPRRAWEKASALPTAAVLD